MHEADYDTNVYYALVAIDRDGNVGEPSNVRQAYVPSPERASLYSEDKGYTNGPEHRIISSTSDKPSKVLLYIVVGIVAFIVLCVVLVLIIVISYRRKKSISSSQTDLNSASIGVNANAAANGLAGGIANVKTGDYGSPGFAVCDEQELSKETNGFLATYSDFTSSNVGDYTTNSSSQNTNPNGAVNSFNAAGGDSGPSTLDGTYGWTEYNNPYVNAQLPAGNTLPTYREFGNNGFAPPSNYYGQQQTVNAMYARPIPKSQRVLYGSGGILNSTPQSGSSNNNTTSASQNNLYRQNLANSINFHSQQQQAPVSSSSGSGDERVPSISPPPLDGTPASEQMRLIGSSASNTPTKSILKKPKSVAVAQNSQIQMQEDQSSQSSKDERLSDSSNVSFSDRDTPTTANANASTVAQQPSAMAEEEAEVPDYSPSNTYLETSFDVAGAAAAAGGEDSRKVPPPTMPKPSKLDESVVNSATLERKKRNITQV